MIKRIGWAGGLLFLVWGIGFAQRIWEGTTTVARYGEFPPSGMYGASNSFERNSIVDVENLSNGKRARIIITGRVSDPTQFLVVSEQVATELGIGKLDVARVRVSPVVTPGIDPSLVKPELPLSPDPDINPSARVSPGTKPEATIAPAAPRALSAPSAPVDSISPAASSTGIDTPWKDPDPANPYTSLEAFMAKRDKAVFSGLSLVLEAEPKEPVSTVPDAPVVPAATTELKEAVPKVVELPLEALRPESKEEVLLQTKDGKRTELESPQSSQDGETQIELQLALEPTGPKPPERLKGEKSPSTMSEAPVATSALSFPIKEIADLSRGFYYLQLGRFAKHQSVAGLWERFHRQYPLVVLKEEKGLRVLVGPLRSDERGILYHTFRSLGLKDTFFVKID